MSDVKREEIRKALDRPEGFSLHWFIDFKNEKLLQNAPKWLESQQKEIERHKEENESLLNTLADIRGTLLPLVDTENNECGDMLMCTVSRPECIGCLAKQIAKQYS